MEYSEESLSQHRIRKAKEDLAEAKELFNKELIGGSINRSYYSIFDAARALLAFDRFDSKKHSGVIHFFHQNYIATKKIEVHFGKILSNAFNMRSKTDYHDFYVAAKSDAQKLIEDAEEFLNMIEKYLENVSEK